MRRNHVGARSRLVGEVLGVIEQLAREDMTLIMVTHEMNFARAVSDRIVFMHQGRVGERDGRRDLRASADGGIDAVSGQRAEPGNGCALTDTAVRPGRDLMTRP